MDEAGVPDEALDWTLAVERAGGNADLAADLLEMLRQELPQRMEAVRTAAARGDESVLQEEIHRVVGSCRYCGVPALERTAGHLDQRLIRGEPWGQEEIDAVVRAAEALKTVRPPD
ncbi:HPt (histidine-containing phosphotransfer) domain-containing protein [Thiohalospira halophila DSM 15071]|uniref:HPt (Histidine-containing phosphotransfer) domain-containing protein n=1 Tax=Thiohalospira halophila DSM 15071 TaxID=1123397 RepID=A0A1I1P2X3_9GAMM|nr:Hpt domain-containing protein [Thiohalospira halophila]SFD04167.1 HPt (histidine-containing phosphotransfer) domain-containing protein [Thiohalospira halophila DSM 15071]